MCEIITMGWRLARGVTPKKCEVSPPKNARCHPQKMRGVTPKKCEVSPLKNARCHPQKMRGVTPKKCEASPPKNARRHPKKCEASPQKMRGVTSTPARSHPENGGMAPHQFFKNNFSRSKPAKGSYSLCMKVIWVTTITEEQTIPAPPVFLLS